MTRCPTCKKSTSFEEHGPFKDALSYREFQISGMCQECQDGFFCTGPPDCDKPCCAEEP